MKRTIFVFLFGFLATIATTAQVPVERERISETVYDEALRVANEKADRSGQRITFVGKYYSRGTLTKTVTDVFESPPGRRYRSRTITEVNGVVTEREERIRVGDQEYHRINNGKWKVPPIPTLTERQMPPGYKPPVVEFRNEHFRVRPERPGQPDIYTWERTTTTDGVPERYTEKYSILNGLIIAGEAVQWEKTPSNITKTEQRTYEHDVQGLKIELPLLVRRTGRR
jgi:hypothetical protein